MSRRYTFTFMCTVKRPNEDDKIFYGKIFFKSLRPFLSYIFLYHEVVNYFFIFMPSPVFSYTVTKWCLPEYRYRECYGIFVSKSFYFVLYRYSIVADPLIFLAGYRSWSAGFVSLRTRSRIRLARILKKYFWLLAILRRLNQNFVVKHVNCKSYECSPIIVDQKLKIYIFLKNFF